MSDNDYTTEDEMAQQWNEHQDHQGPEEGEDEYPQEEVELPVSPVALREAATVHEELGSLYAEQAEALASQYSPSKNEQVTVAALYRHVAACQRLLAQAERTLADALQEEQEYPF